MDKNKQIEEMANIIALKAFERAHEINGDENLADIVATDLYAKGYRKASEVAEKIFEEIDIKFQEILSCIHGGVIKAMLNGDKEAEEIHRNILPMAQVIRECVAELKKKYTEGNNV